MKHKHIFSTLLALGLLVSFCMPAIAKTDKVDKPAKAEKTAKKAKKAKAEEVDTTDMPAVPASLVNKEFVNGAKLNTKAKVYFIYQSRSACGICVMECPAIVDAYKGMKGKDAELVMLNIDQNKEIAAKWAKDSKMKFPVVAPHDANGVPFPYTGGGTLPCMVALDAEGNKLGEAGGKDVAAFVGDWKKIVRDYKKEEKKAAREAAKEKKSADTDSESEEPDDSAE